MKKDFLAITDCTSDEILSLLDLAADLKRRQKAGEAHHLLAGKTLGLVFLKPSTRTRISFDAGMYHLGGYALYLSPAEIGLGTRETVSDVARVLSRYLDGIMARLFAHSDIEELARWADVPVINGLTDWLHPCQILADLLTIREHLGRHEGVHVAYIGDGNNVCNSWINLAARLPIKLSMGVPPGYEPDAALLEQAKAAGLSELAVHHSPVDAIRGADFVYTDVWASMGQEDEAAARLKLFDGFQINSELLGHAAPDCKLLHCLPAHRGEEVSEEVFESDRSIVFDQAENRLHLQKALLCRLMGGA